MRWVHVRGRRRSRSTPSASTSAAAWARSSPASAGNATAGPACSCRAPWRCCWPRSSACSHPLEHPGGRQTQSIGNRGLDGAGDGQLRAAGPDGAPSNKRLGGADGEVGDERGAGGPEHGRDAREEEERDDRDEGADAGGDGGGERGDGGV